MEDKNLEKSNNGFVLEGIVADVSPKVSGMSGNGKAWSRRTVVVSQDNGRFEMKDAVFECFKEEMTENLSIGEPVAVHFNLGSFKTSDGRVFPRVTAWKIESRDMPRKTDYSTPSGVMAMHRAQSVPELPDEEGFPF